MVFGLFKRKAPAPNIVVYCLTSIREGKCYATPFGVMPRPSADEEAKLKAEWKPSEGDYQNSRLNGVSVIYAWGKGKLDAACFFSSDDLEHCPGFQPFDEGEELLISHLRHFPRD